MNVARSGMFPTSRDSLRINESLTEEHTRPAPRGFHVCLAPAEQGLVGSTRKTLAGHHDRILTNWATAGPGHSHARLAMIDIRRAPDYGGWQIKGLGSPGGSSPGARERRTLFGEQDVGRPPGIGQVLMRFAFPEKSPRPRHCEAAGGFSSSGGLSQDARALRAGRSRPRFTRKNGNSPARENSSG